MKTNEVTAVIGGERARFRLERDQPLLLQRVEHKVGKSLFALFRDIADGTWSARAFLPVLSAAHVGAPHRLVGAESALMRKTLEGNPPGVYAPLVAKVLEAHLFGIPVDEVFVHGRAGGGVISGEMIGEAALAKKLAQAGKRAEARVRKRARALGEEIAGVMRSRVPVDTGGTRDSIRVEDDPDGNGVIVRAGGTPETTKPTADGRHEFDVAVLQNFGTQHIPATHFFTHTANEYRKKIVAEMGEAAVEAAVEKLE